MAADCAVGASSRHRSHHHHRAHHGHKRHRHVVPAPPTNGMRMGLRNTRDQLALKSSVALVVDQDSGETLLQKNANAVLPIASLTKLMTALVVVKSGLPMDEMLEISNEDVDTQRHTHSRLRVGTRLTRDQLLLLALMSSENRAALALSRNYPGGRSAFIAEMNQTAQELGMSSTHYADPAGLSNGSVSSAHDLLKLLNAVGQQTLIRFDSTQPEGEVAIGGRVQSFHSSNQLVRAGDWQIELQKTGFTNEAGRCLVMQAVVQSRRLAMIFLDSTGKSTRYADAARVRRWLEVEARNNQRTMPGAVASSS